MQTRNNLREDIRQRIESVKHGLNEHGIDHVMNQHVMQPTGSILGASMEQSLKGEIAEKFKVAEHQVIIVGSAKLGFSAKPGQYLKYFSAQSDVDVAICCPKLFYKIWTEVLEITKSGEWFNNFDQFCYYHVQGWIRPDKLPTSNVYRTCAMWWEFFQYLSSKESYDRLPIRAGLYYDEYFLRQYQFTSLNGLREHLKREAA